MDVVKSKINVSVNLPKKDLSNWNYEKQDLSVSTEFNPQSNVFNFKLNIPNYIFEGVKGLDDKYDKLSKTLSSPMLSMLLEDLRNICSDAMSIKDRETAKEEKYIAIKFNQSHRQDRDDFNHASMGFKTSSNFQFFVVYKAIKSPNSLDRYNYKSNVLIKGINTQHTKALGSASNREWHWYGIGVIERDFKTVKWTQEREDFLTNIQNKFVELNQKLDNFLGDLDEDKMSQLVNNPQLILTA